MDLSQNFKCLSDLLLSMLDVMNIDIPGPTGVLEAMLDATGEVPENFAVLCHPHPQYGGNMFDTVLDVLATACQRYDVATLRFNFRGVGASAGGYDNGSGEVQDLLAAIAWLKTEYAVRDLWLGGYSFGANVVWKALPLTEAPQRVLLVAPPVGFMDFDGPGPGCPVDVFAGDADEFIDNDVLARWQDVESHLIHGANHFFMGAQDQLGTAIDEVLSARQQRPHQ